MFVGFSRKNSKPLKAAKIIAITSKQQGIDIVYFTPKDVDMEREKINGKILLHNQWTNIEVLIPKFIDVNPYLFLSNSKVMDFLNKKTILSPNQFGIIAKDKLQETLLSSNKIKHLAIPTDEIHRYGDILKLLERHVNVVIKPIKGLGGKNVYILKRYKDGYTLGTQKSEENLTNEQLKEFYDNNLYGKKYIGQKYIASKNEY